MPPSPTYLAAQEKALAWEPAEDIYQLSGTEASKFLNAYVTQDIKSLAENRITSAAFLTQKGKLVTETRALRLPGRFLLLFPQTYGPKVESHLATFLLFASVELKNVNSEWRHFAILGPQTTTLLEGPFGPGLQAEAGAVLTRSFAGQEILLFPSERFGLPAWEILMPNQATEAWRQILQDWEDQAALHQADTQTLQILRLEAGLPAMGLDMSEDNLVAEVGLDLSATSFNKGCYLGQETTARIQSRGHVNRKLAGLRLEAMPSSLPAELFQGDKKVGTLSSAVESPKFGAPIGLGTVALAAWEKPEKVFLKDGTKKIQVDRLP